MMTVLPETVHSMLRDRGFTVCNDGHGADHYITRWDKVRPGKEGRVRVVVDDQTMPGRYIEVKVMVETAPGSFEPVVTLSSFTPASLVAFVVDEVSATVKNRV